MPTYCHIDSTDIVENNYRISINDCLVQLAMNSRINSVNSECHIFRLGCWLNPTLTNFVWLDAFAISIEKYRFLVFINCDKTNIKNETSIEKRELNAINVRTNSK
jgi:hypothetical protein